MLSVFLFLLSAVLARLAAAALRCEESPPWHARVSWLFVLLASWLAVGAVAWCPSLPFLVAALLGAMFDRGRAGWHRPVFETAPFLAAPFLSVPLTVLPVLVTAGAVVSLGVAFDALARRYPPRWRSGLGALSLALPSVVFVSDVDGALANLRALAAIVVRSGALTVAVTPVDSGERVELPGGSVAWLDRPPGDGPFPAVIFFHGNYRDGAHQVTGRALRRGLVDAGFIVLALDHLGYGASPGPALDAPVTAWDPLPAGLAARDLLLARSDVGSLIVMGHSQGAGDVMRFLAADDTAVAGVTIGGGLLERTREPHWHYRFQEDRELPQNSLPLEKYREIRDRYYDVESFAEELPVSHVPILVIDLEFDGGLVVRTRDKLYDSIPGRKERITITGSSHELSVVGKTFLAGDTRSANRAARRVAEFVHGLRGQ